MVKVAILGFGTVGSGVADVMRINAEEIARNAAEEISVKYIVDVREFPGSIYEGLFTKDFGVVEKDPEVKIVIETIGGTGVALDFTKRSLLAGKSVVTSNKELVATHGVELLNIAKEKNVNYLFEASVGGGIPILRPISQCLAANKIEEVYGILNGTTNYILTEMIKNGLPFDTALKQAQENGYAEANPAADIEGHDACRKICILSALSFGRHLYPDSVPAEGITGVTLEDVNFAEKIGCKIKLLGRAVQQGGKVAAYVAPHLVPDTNLLASVEGVMNAILVRGNAVGDVMFYGAGAGKMPTASAVVADVIDAAKHRVKRKDIFWAEADPCAEADAALLESAWYIRTGADKDTMQKLLEGKGTLIGEKDGVYAYKTGVFSQKAVKERAAGAEILSMFRILE